MRVDVHMKIAFTFAVAVCLTSSLHAAETKPLRVLLITGGCCHDYKNQKDILKKGLEQRANIEVTQVHSDSGSTKPPLGILGNPDYAKDFDLVIHDECGADINEPATIKGVLNPHQNGTPGINLHCAMHCYRIGDYGKKANVGEERAMWFDYLGLQSSGHGPQEPIAIAFDGNSPITKGMENWTTIKEELYNNVYIHDSARPLARGKQTTHTKKKDAEGKETIVDKDNEYVVIWTNEYGDKKTRVFNTTIGHNNATVSDPRYLDLITRGALWACGKLGEDGKPLSGYEKAK
jgi:hypothetical protein